MIFSDWERDEVYRLREKKLSDEMIADYLNERREIQRWKEQQGII